MKIAALIVAAGRGTRSVGPIAKQWQPLSDRRVIDWTVDKFQFFNVKLMVLHPNEMDTQLFQIRPQLSVV